MGSQDANIRKCELETKALVRTLKSLNTSNTKYRLSNHKADLGSTEANTLRKLEAQSKAAADLLFRRKRDFQRLAGEVAALGQPVALDGVTWLQGEGRLDGPTLVVFFEAWCPHCRRAMPELAELDRTWSDDGLAIVAVTRGTRDTTDDQVMQLVHDSGVHLPVGREDGRVADAAKVSGIPAAALVSGGRVVWRGHPGNLEDGTIRALLAQ